jgi:hypothetical protein
VEGNAYYVRGTAFEARWEHNGEAWVSCGWEDDGACDLGMTEDAAN